VANLKKVIMLAANEMNKQISEGKKHMHTGTVLIEKGEKKLGMGKYRKGSFTVHDKEKKRTKKSGNFFKIGPILVIVTGIVNESHCCPPDRWDQH